MGGTSSQALSPNWTLPVLCKRGDTATHEQTCRVCAQSHSEALSYMQPRTEVASLCQLTHKDTGRPRESCRAPLVVRALLSKSVNTNSHRFRCVCLQGLSCGGRRPFALYLNDATKARLPAHDSLAVRKGVIRGVTGAESAFRRKVVDNTDRRLSERLWGACALVPHD